MIASMMSLGMRSRLAQQPAPRQQYASVLLASSRWPAAAAAAPRRQLLHSGRWLRQRTTDRVLPTGEAGAARRAGTQQSWRRWPRPRWRVAAALAATGAGSAAALGASWQLSPALSKDAVHRVEWSTEQVRELLSDYQSSRTLQNYCAALGIVGLGLFDLAMLTYTGVFGLLVGAGGVVVYVYDNLRPVNGDDSGRLRFIDVSVPHEELLGLLEYHNVKEEATLMPESSPEHQMVARVGRRIAAATLLNDDDGDPAAKGGGRKVQWEFHCEDKDEVNAFVLPGGKVFVCRGLLEVCQTDDELAVVMAHEAGHVQARHTAERLSMARFPSVLKSVLVLLAAAGAVPFDAASEVMMFAKIGGIDLATFMLLSLPYSRKHEKEADVLGLDIMVRACVDPLIATKVWEKMAQRGAHAHDHESSRQKKQQQQQPPKSQNQKQQKRPAQMPTILSTHPHDETRAKYLGELAPEKAVAYHVAGCGRVSEHVLRMGRRALMEKEAAARNAPLQAKE